MYFATKLIANKKWNLNRIAEWLEVNSIPESKYVEGMEAEKETLINRTIRRIHSYGQRTGITRNPDGRRNRRTKKIERRCCSTIPNCCLSISYRLYLKLVGIRKITA